MEELIKKFLYGYGDGYGNGDGDGYGNGDGAGDGAGAGAGNGNGNGDGAGYGAGAGNGNGNGNGIRINTYKGNRVYYIDDIPCYFIAVNKNLLFAKIMLIDISDFSVSLQYVFKFNGCFAHGETLKSAKRDAEQKYYSQLNIEDKIDTFKNTFKPKVLYPAIKFYEWHSTLTGSCQSGKDLFIKQNGINMESKMTVEDFIRITKNAYGGEVIKMIDYE